MRVMTRRALEIPVMLVRVYPFDLGPSARRIRQGVMTPETQCPAPVIVSFGGSDGCSIAGHGSS